MAIRFFPSLKLGDFVNLGESRSFWLCGSIVASPIIYRLVPNLSRYVIRQCFFYKDMIDNALCDDEALLGGGGRGYSSLMPKITETVSPKLVIFWISQ